MPRWLNISAANAINSKHSWISSVSCAQDPFQSHFNAIFALTKNCNKCKKWFCVYQTGQNNMPLICDAGENWGIWNKTHQELIHFKSINKHFYLFQERADFSRTKSLVARWTHSRNLLVFLRPTSKTKRTFILVIKLKPLWVQTSVKTSTKFWV